MRTSDNERNRRSGLRWRLPPLRIRIKNWMKSNRKTRFKRIFPGSRSWKKWIYRWTEQAVIVLSVELRWMSWSCISESAVETCSTTDSSVDNTSRKSEIDAYSTGARAWDQNYQSWRSTQCWWRLEQEVYQDLDGDRYLFPIEKVFDNAADDLELIAVSKRPMSLLPQKEAVRTDLQPFKQKPEPLAMIWCVKIEVDTHQPNELSSQLRVMKTYLKARYRLSDLLRAQRIDRMTSSLKRWIKNGAPDKGDLDEDSYGILRQYYMQKKGRLYLSKDEIVACKRRKEVMIQYKYNAIRLPQLYQTELLFKSHAQMGNQGIDKVYQRIMKRLEWPAMKKSCEKWLTACLSCQQVKDRRKLRFPLQSIESSELKRFEGPGMKRHGRSGWQHVCHANRWKILGNCDFHYSRSSHSSSMMWYRSITWRYV